MYIYIWRTQKCFKLSDFDTFLYDKKKTNLYLSPSRIPVWEQKVNNQKENKSFYV